MVGLYVLPPAILAVSWIAASVKMVLQILLQECSDRRTYSTAFKRFPVQSMYFCILTTCL